MTAPDPSAAAAAAPRHPLVARILDPAAEEAIRLTAARGALPIPVQDLLYLQVRLLRDPQPAIAAAAAGSLGAVSADTLRPVLRDPGCDALLIDHCCRSGRLSDEDLARAIAHPAIPDDTLEALAAGGSADTLRLIVTNEVRIIRSPRLLEILRSNPNLAADGRRRLGELERDFIGKDPLIIRRRAEPAPEEPAAPAEAPPGEDPDEDTEPETAGSAAEPAPSAADAEAALENSPAFQRILKLNVPERVSLAMKGNAEERAILIRDSTKMVALQVLKSPRLSENELTVYAGMRNVHEDILRQIASHREWTKSYSVMHALVRNPKTPPGLTLQFLPRLGTRDLKLVVKDRGVPEMLRRLARDLFTARTQRTGKPGKRSH